MAINRKLFCFWVKAGKPSSINGQPQDACFDYLNLFDSVCRVRNRQIMGKRLGFRIKSRQPIEMANPQDSS